MRQRTTRTGQMNKRSAHSTRAQQILGAKDLLHDAITAAVNATERVHLAIARKPYALLERIQPIARPVKLVEQIQLAITGVAYGGTRVLHHAVNAVVTQALKTAK